MDTAIQATLTPREEQVLCLLRVGHPNKSMARILKISPRTIEVHRTRIMSKFGAKNAVDLVIRTREWAPAKIAQSDIALNTPLVD